MYKNDCKTIRLLLEEADPRQELNADTLEHVRTCGDCHEFYASELKLRQLVAALPGVEAPADFDFRLRARIKRDQVRPTFSFSGFGIPSLAAAALILLVGGVVLVRNVLLPQHQTSTTSRVESSVNLPSNPPAPTKSVSTGQEIASSSAVKTESELVGNRPANKPFLIIDKTRPVSKEFSSVGATVVKQESALAGVQLPLSFPVQTLSVSLDDGSGVAHTISFPTVSFGSERVLTRQPHSFQGSAKSDW